LQIDAHADLRDEYDGTPHSHASIMARGQRFADSGAVQVGIRSISADEARSLRFRHCRQKFSGRKILSGEPIGLTSD
jgi:arginase family enzyme